jgi:hypothetical protein
MPGPDEEEEDDMASFTFRSHGLVMPSSGLEEELCAVMLRRAKERFRKRKLGISASSDGEPESDEDDAASSSSGSESSVSQGASSTDDEHMEDSNIPAESSQKGDVTDTLKPAIATDDAASYEFLRPAARRILETFDRTLTILHNARFVTVYDTSKLDKPDKSDSASIAESIESHGDAEPSASEGPDDELPPGTEEHPDVDMGLIDPALFDPTIVGEAPVSKGEPPATVVNPAEQNSRGGRRPQVHVPREGGRRREMTIRVARENKKRIPVKQRRHSGTSGGDSSDVAPKKTKQRRQSTTSEEQSSDASSVALPHWSNEEKTRFREKKLATLGLRDWREVLGAAALAGFPPEVVARATQRCANLFHQPLDLHTLVEAPAEINGDAAVKPERYIPGQVLESSEDDLSDRSLPGRNPYMRKPAASAQGGHQEVDMAADASRGRKSFRWICRQPDCRKVLSSKGNLVRHLVQHHGLKDAVVGENDSSMDEVEGAVHVDGFMKIIKPRQGWRGIDARQRARKKTKQSADSGG